MMAILRGSVAQTAETGELARLGDPNADRGVPKDQGPMIYLGHQICKRMEQIGYPSKIAVAYRSPEQQEVEFAEGQSKARAWQSPHQFYEAVDICHKYKGWPKDTDPYWEALASVVRNVEADYGVELTHGMRDWGWDYAHVQLRDWKAQRQMLRTATGYRKPTPEELYYRFREVLPKVQYPEPEWLSTEKRLEVIDSQIKSGEMGVSPQFVRDWKTYYARLRSAGR